MPPPAAAAILLGCVVVCVCGQSTARYRGAEVGALSELQHGVRGRLYAIDSRTLFLHDFHYDGEGPTAYFYVGTSKAVGAAGGKRLRDERGGAGPLRRYRGEGITLSLPEGLTLRDIKWFSVWCDEFAVNFGSVSIPRSLEYPKPVKVGALRGVHGVSSDAVVVVDAQTLLVPNFSYDGEAPDAKFWVGRGDKPSPQGIRIPDENGREEPLRKYDRKTIVLTLPGELTVFDIGHFGVWCEAFTVNFGHVQLPRALLRNIPPSLKMLGVSPQSRNKELSSEPAAAGGSSGSDGRGKPRRPLQRLDATTYRPHLRPGGAPLAAFHQSPHTSLHRRADDYTPAPAPAPSSHLGLDTDGDDRTLQQTDDSAEPGRPQPQPDDARPQTDRPPPDSPQLQHQQAAQPPQPQPQDQYYTQLKSQEIYTGHFDAPEFYQFQPQYRAQYTPQYQAEQYQLQAYQQQQYEQRLLAQQYPPFQQYGQYQLVPY